MFPPRLEWRTSLLRMTGFLLELVSPRKHIISRGLPRHFRGDMLNVTMGRSQVFRFGPYEADIHSGELRKRGLRITVRDKSFEVLACLLESPGKLVTRDELRRRLWPEHVFVDFNSGLNSAVNRLRCALRDRPDKPRYIETLPRRGYRFIGAVEDVQSAARRTLAVLPFTNLNRDPENEYFADGITDALITELGGIASLRVISRQSIVHLKGSVRTLPEVAGELGAHAVLEGSVLRADDRVRITAQLILASPEQHVWAQSFERGMTGILDVQREIARAIAERIQAVLTPKDARQLSRPRSVSPAAYEAFLKGGFYMDRGSAEAFQKAFGYFEGAIALDPGFAPAWARLGLCLGLLGFWGHLHPREASARSAETIDKALDLDDSLALAHAVRGWNALCYDWDFARCEHELGRSLELNPSEIQGRGTLAVFQFIVARDIRAGIASTREMLQIDPVSLYTNTSAAWFLVFAGDYPRAAEQASRTIDMFPDALHAWYALGQARLGTGSLDEAIHAFERAAAISRDAISIGYLGNALARAGKTADAEALLAELSERSTREYISPKAFISIYGGLGDMNRAYHWIEEAFRRRDSTLVFLDVVPTCDPLRGHAGYNKILRRVGLPPTRHSAIHPDPKRVTRIRGEVGSSERSD